MNHPNAVVGGIGGGAGLGTLVVFLLNQYLDAGLGPEAGSAVAGLVAALVLLIGTEGLKGIWRHLVEGAGK